MAQNFLIAWRSILALMLREMSTRYSRSPGGYMWAFLEPVAAILALAIGFSLIIQTPPMGTSFLLFYATGFIVLNMFTTLAHVLMWALTFSKPLLHYPVVSWLDALLARFFLNTLTGIFVGGVILGGIILLEKTHAKIDMLPILTATGVVLLLGAGVGVLNCALQGVFKTWNVVWSISTKPLFLASAIFYRVEDLPRDVQGILLWNPLTHLVGLMRTGFYAHYSPHYISVEYVVLCALFALALGLALLSCARDDILNT